MKTNRDTKRCNTTSVSDDYLPGDANLEAAVLGALLLENQYLADVRGVITPTARCAGLWERSKIRQR